MTHGTPPPSDAPRRTAVGAVRTLLGSGYVTLVGLALGIYVPRALQPEEYALFGVVASFVTWTGSIGLTFLTSGLNKLLVDARDDWRGLARSSLLAGILLMGLATAALWLGAPWLADIFGDDRLTRLFRILAFDPLLSVVFRTLMEIARARRQYERRAIILACYWTARGIATVALVLAGLGSRGAVLGLICGSALAGIVGFAMARPGVPGYVAPLKPLFAFQWPLAIAAVTGALSRSAGLWLVKGLAPEPGMAGLYAVALMIGVRIGVLVSSVNLAMAPKLVASVNEGNREAVAELIRGAYRFVLVALLPVIAIFATVGRELVPVVFSEAYADAYLPAAMLLCATLCAQLAQTAVASLIAANKPVTRMWCALLTLPLAIVLDLLLIPDYGIVGAAVATTTGFVLFASASMAASWRHFRIGVPGPTVLRCGSAAAIVGLAGTLWHVQGGWVIAQGGVLAMAYVGLLVTMGELTAHDLRPVMAALRLKPRSRNDVL